MKPAQSNQSGLTLIELMVVLVIIGIIAGIAYPSYLDQVRQTRRAEATKMLMEVANQQERFFTNNNQYAANMSTLGYGSDNQDTENGYYTVTTTSTNAPMGFTVTAVPQDSQAEDTECGTYTINNVGNKTSSGTGTEENCW